MSRDIEGLVAAMDLEEKTSFLAGADMWSTIAIERLGIPSVLLTDGPNGARGPALPASMDGPSTSTSTCMPSGAALGATWDRALVERVGAVIATEARMKSCRVLLGPTVNLHRSPLGGRNFESYSEDPLLAGRLGAAWIRGAQREGVACTVKHFAGNESEDGRMLVDSIIDGRTLREMHLRPFEIAVREGGALGIMTAYNRLNGEYPSDSSWLLDEVLRREWGFAGFVVSDWFAFADTCAAIVAGLDLEMPGPGRAFGSSLRDAVLDGRVEESFVDAAVLRLLSVFERIGALDDTTSVEPVAIDLPAHRAVAREAASAAIVLLKNEGVLPLDADRPRRVAVIGPNADRAVIMGGGSASLSVPAVRTALEALRARLGADVVVEFEPGVDIGLSTPEIPAQWLGTDGLSIEYFDTDERGGNGASITTGRIGSGSITWWFTGPEGVPDRFRWVASGNVRVPSAGRWVLSLVQTEDAVVSIDGEIVIDTRGRDLPAGHEFFGLGRREQVIEIDLDPDRPIAVEVRSSVTRPGLVLGAKLGLRPSLPVDAIERATDLAARADEVIVVVGTDGEWETEGHDRDDLALPGRQDELVERVLAVAPDATVVVNAGSAVTMPWAPRCQSLLQTWFGGLEAADALVDVLLGEVDPGGRLPMTIPSRLEDGPSWGNFPGEGGRVIYGERILVGYRWFDSRAIDVTFPFGHGLSYADLVIGEPSITALRASAGDKVSFSLDVTNTSERRGSGVVQLYLAAPDGPVLRAPRSLVDFVKVDLGPGESATVELAVDERSLARWVEADPSYAALVDRQASQAAFMPPAARPEPGGWIVDQGRYQLLVGRSSRDIVHVLDLDVERGWTVPAA